MSKLIHLKMENQICRSIKSLEQVYKTWRQNLQRLVQ